jgi:hypothetical protein
LSGSVGTVVGAEMNFNFEEYVRQRDEHVKDFGAILEIIHNKKKEKEN